VGRTTVRNMLSEEANLFTTTPFKFYQFVAIVGNLIYNKFIIIKTTQEIIMLMPMMAL